MADPDPNTPQVVDPERVVDLTRLLQIRGPLGVLNVLDTIVPVVNMGDVVARSVEVRPPFFTSTDIFSAGLQTAAPINFVHADTGPLAEGIYDIQLQIPATATTGNSWNIEHRDAANTAALAVWNAILITGTGGVLAQTFAYEFAINERLRIINLGAFAAGELSVAHIFARRRA